MPAKGPGGSTPFEDMSHEQMLAWLDQANAGTVQAAADRLVTAAKEIRKIADELKVRPQWVEWKGEGANAFRTWSADLANSTLRLGDFSEGAAKWLAQTSDAIAQAQVSIPRDAGSAQANLDAAQAAHNDPDAASVGAKSASELAALAADKEEVRQQAAAQMRKLGETYSWSATQMNALERPRFPPPPEAFVPGERRIDQNEVVATGGGGAGTPNSASAATGSRRATAGTPAVGDWDVPGSTSIGSVHVPMPEAPVGVSTEINSTTFAPQTPTITPGPVGMPPGGRAEGSTALPLGTAPPAFGSGLGLPVGQTGPGRMAAGGRPVSLPGQGLSGPASGRGPVSDGTSAARDPAGPVQPVQGGRTAAMPGRDGAGAAPGRSPVNNGIVGGRPTSPVTGQPTSRMPRGTVVGGETPLSGTSGRGPVSAECRGALPASEGGIVGGRPQQQRRSASRPFTSGGSGLVRSQGPQEETSPPRGIGRTTGQPSGTDPTRGPANGSGPSTSRQNGEQNTRSHNRSEGRQTRQQEGGRPTPPVAD
jgi:hypothetical protein